MDRTKIKNVARKPLCLRKWVEWFGKHNRYTKKKKKREGGDYGLANHVTDDEIIPYTEYVADS